MKREIIDHALNALKKIVDLKIQADVSPYTKLHPKRYLMFQNVRCCIIMGSRGLVPLQRGLRGDRVSPSIPILV
ncbi:MAG: hypothetical protein HQL06_01065 [Nitrospirae bacterium]|nr:hypothetical protein [Nitrospirota bacterium]